MTLLCSLSIPVAFAQTREPVEVEKEKPVVVTVVLERVYLDGEFSQEVFKEKIYSMENFWTKYDQWELIDMNEKRVVFREQVDDISPLLKTNGYFGITEEGILTIFNGKPQKTNIIHSFFQLDVGKLESAKHEELKEGIPIKNKDRYVKVLETFKSYSVPEKQAN
jgi:forespore regulator of the sigma-K checkpoint